MAAGRLNRSIQAKFSTLSTRPIDTSRNSLFVKELEMAAYGTKPTL
jgi:hypothetical protein